MSNNWRQALLTLIYNRLRWVMVGDTRAAGVCRDKDEIEASSPGGLYIRALIPLLTSLPVHHSGGMHKTDAAVRGET